MLYKNVLALICMLGMALALPINEKDEDISLVELETAPTTGEVETEVILVEHYVTDDPFADNEEAEPVTEEIPPFEDEEDRNVDLGDVAEEEVTEKAEEAEVIDEEETPFIPENEEPDVDPTVCSKDLLLMGNTIDHSHACDDIYEACTNKELISVIMYYYSKDSPVAIEYTINENINKKIISEKCGKILINSKIFQEETTVIEGDIKNPDPVKRVVSLNENVDVEAPAAEKLEKEVEEKNDTENGDGFAEFSEDDIVEN